MPYVPPTNISVGQTVTTAIMNDWWSGNVSFLANPPACRLTESGGQVLNNNTLTDLTFSAEQYDTDGMHSGSSERITIKTAGIYLVTGYATFATDNDITEMLLRLLVDGATDIGQQRIAGSLAGFEILSVTGAYRFNVGQYVTLNARHINTSAGTNTVTGRAFSATWLGLG